MMRKGFEGKVALVTGGSSGIGRMTAVTFAREGAKVVVAARRTAEGEATAELIRSQGGNAVFIQADVSQTASVERLVAKTVAAFGRIDCAFNNAGVSGKRRPLTEQSEENWDFVINTNLKGVWLSLKYVIPHMLEQGGGAIVNMSSVGGLVGLDWGVSPYIASKHGVVGLTKAAALEYATANIRVNAVCPAIIQTAMTDRLTDTPGEMAWAQGLHPIGRLGSSEEVAEAVVWLCSERASFITGHALPIDGGLVAQ